MSGKLFLDCIILAGDASLTCSLLSVYKQLRSTKNASSMSLLSLTAIVFARCIHSLAYPVFNLHFTPSHLPITVYFILDIVNALLGLYVVLFFLKYFRQTYEPEKDDFGSLVLKLVDKDTVAMRWICFYGATVAAAVIWHILRRSDNRNILSAFFCSYYETIGFFALLPQLWMFQRDKVVSSCLGNFIVYTALHRTCTLAFWVCFPYVYTHRYLDNRIVQMVSEIMNIAILSDFLYFYIRAKMRGDKDITIGDSVV